MTAEELNTVLDKIAVSQAKRDIELDKFLAGIADSKAETDKEIKALSVSNAELAVKVRETSESVKRVSESVGSITNNTGSITEEYFFNSMNAKPILGGLRYDEVKRNINGKILKVEDEFDIVMYNGDSIALIECKSKAHESDLKRLVDKKATNFKTLFPFYKDYKIYLGLASFCFYDELEEMAKQHGVAIIKQKGDVVEIEADNLKAY